MEKLKGAAFVKVCLCLREGSNSLTLKQVLFACWQEV